MPPEIWLGRGGFGGRVADSGMGAISVRNGRGSAGKRLNRSDGAAVTPAPGDRRRTGVERECIVAVLGFARRWLTMDSPVRRYLTDAIFPYYIVHQTAIIMIAHELHGRDLPAWLEASIVITGTLIACVLTYEVVRRIAVLRPLFGLRPFEFTPTAPARQPTAQLAQ
jgi:hypothetical protein